MKDDNKVKVYTALGDIGTELRAAVDVSPGEILFRESAFAFACENEEDDDSLPAIVQVAMNALLRENEENNNNNNNSMSGTRICTDEDEQTSKRHFKHLTATAENDDAQKNALFAWGAEQILSRLRSLVQTNQDLAMKTIMSKDDVVSAIRRVALNTFTVKSLIEADLNLALENDSDNDELSFDLAHSMMQIGAEDARGIGLYILASAANHSCAPNTFVTFDNDNEITFRATKSIQAQEEITISYGPVVGVGMEGNFQQRREELLESHCFHCQCAACVTEETTWTTSSTSSADDFEAMQFIEHVIVEGSFTASEALQKSMDAPENIVRTSMFGKAMTDTAVQASIAFDVEIALGFQKLALKSLELRCPKDHIAIAYEILRVCLLLVCNVDGGGVNVNGKEIERARGILSRHYGEEYAYKQTLDKFSRNSSS